MRGGYGLVGGDGRMDKRSASQKRRFLGLEKPVKYNDFVIYVLAQVTWLWCQTTTELAPSVGGTFKEKHRKIPMCTLIEPSDGNSWRKLGDHGWTFGKNARFR